MCKIMLLLLATKYLYLSTYETLTNIHIYTKQDALQAISTVN